MGICSLNYNHNKASLLVSNLFSFKCVSAMKQPSKAQTIKTKLHFQIPIFLLKIWPLLGKHIKKTVCMIIVNFLGFYKLLQFLTIFSNFGQFVVCFIQTISIKIKYYWLWNRGGLISESNGRFSNCPKNAITSNTRQW